MKIAIIRLLGSSLQTQSVFLDFFGQKTNRKDKSYSIFGGYLLLLNVLNIYNSLFYLFIIKNSIY